VDDEQGGGAFGIRREHQALYGIGLVRLAFSAAQWVGADGFLASFAAGLAVALLNINLCDCFLDYGATTAEAAMLLAFAVISQIVSQFPVGTALLLACVALLLARPLAIGLALRRSAISWQARVFIGWFGPRGLNSMLLALLVLHARVPHAEYLLAIVGVVVTISVIAHGVTATPLSALYAHTVEDKTLAEERGENAAELFGKRGDDPLRIPAAELAHRLESEQPPLILDARTRSQYRLDHTKIPGSTACCRTISTTGPSNIFPPLQPMRVLSLPIVHARMMRPVWRPHGDLRKKDWKPRYLRADLRPGKRNMLSKRSRQSWC
jgi:hypothetical protein